MNGNIPQSPGEVAFSDKVELNRPDSEYDIRQRVICQLDYATDWFYVYYVECELRGWEFKEAKRKAAERLPGGKAPDWLYPAWNADEIYYIGQTARLSQRLADHHVRPRRGTGDKDEPSRLTAVSDCVEAGIVAKRSARHAAEKAEERVANAWRAGDDRRFVYYS
jgi:predicted GIY-YIG superfamily endonuclease